MGLLDLHEMNGLSPGSLFCSRSAHMEENKRSKIGDEKGKSNTTEVEEDEKVDITCVKGEVAMLTENDDARGKKSS